MPDMLVDDDNNQIIWGRLPDPNAACHKICKFTDCENIVGRSGARGYCNSHYGQLRRNNYDESTLYEIEKRFSWKDQGGYRPGQGHCCLCKKIIPLNELVVNYCSPCWSRYRRLKKYNLTEEKFLAIYEQQKKICLICENSIFIGINLAVDHNHKTDEIRGLLCKSCNLGLGIFKDNIDLFKKAILYLSERL